MSRSYRIADLPADDRPRERLEKLGAQALGSAELIAILLRVGVQGESAVHMGQRILQNIGGLSGLHRAAFDELCAEHGIGSAKAAQIKAAIELGRRLMLESPKDRPTINSPADAAALVQYEMSALEKEEMRVILLDTRNHVLDIVTVAHGSLNSAQMRVGEIFTPAIRLNAAALIAVHNHPSGDLKPSPNDVAITRAMLVAGKLLDIEILDHLIIGLGSYTSLKEKKLGF
ncbi:MAG: DNA repair protein RadC [Anaerolineae bacterium]|jgi:DNA repair protein RadC|nr:DNA repair protein RadC [Anaerolineae bacterium]MBT3714595.1 DNA repair protein RadC [Anaerolineae bacterium]MBT4459787.1 DNA repair protein RadC [Anaerolineae bacterium]MBT6062942.1 DNA repair protein RadC [Anaerolineae bacterium]MBT6322910.1 DNA repair protein RadC [Anaerolineae bacterium]